jgi:hypothetical protein
MRSNIDAEHIDTEQESTFRPASTIKKPVHIVISAAAAACLAGALSLGTAASASASPRDARANVKRVDSHGGFRGWDHQHSGNGYIVERGTVSAAPGSTAPTTFTLNVKGPNNNTTTTVTVDASASTKLTEPGFSSAALANIVAGDRVLVVGTQAGANTVDATSVVLPAARAFGTVATAPGASAPTTFTIKVQGFEMRGTSAAGATSVVTVNVSTSTKLRQLGKTAPALSGIVDGAKVAVAGTQDGASTISATEVVLFPTNTGHDGYRGRGFFGWF